MSKGMKQKLGLVAALMHDPDILIFDEPTSGLDPLMQSRFVDLVASEKKKGKTILLSSHMFEEVERTCDRIGILRGNGLVAKYVDDSSMVSLMSAPVRRSTIALTQGAVMVSGTLILTVYITVLVWFSGEYYFPRQLDLGELLQVNAGLFCLHLCLGGICFFASCLFSETRYSLGVGAGLPILMYVFQMMANMGGKAENAKYFTVFTLFQPEELAAGESGAVAGALVLLALGILLYGAAVAVFTRKDLHI